MRVYTLSLLALSTCLTIIGCDKENQNSVVVEITNTTSVDLLEPKPFEDFDTVRIVVAGYEAEPLPDLLAGQTVRYSLPADREFGWGDPMPSQLVGTLGDTKYRINGGYWCNVGFYTDPVNPGVYRYEVATIKDSPIPARFSIAPVK